MNTNINEAPLDVTIRPIASRYGSFWASIRATFRYGFENRVTAREERAAVAAAHRLAADLIDLMPPAADWCLPQVELVSSYDNVVETRIVVELMHGTNAEKDAALELFHDVIPPPRQ